MKQKFNVMQSAESNEHLEIYYVANNVATNEINEAVYTVLCHVAQKVLDRSTCHISGDRTAAEIAGYVDSKWRKVLTPLTNEHHTMAPAVQITVGDTDRLHPGQAFSCIFPTEAVFEQMAEWEGVMKLAPKNYHRFACECKGEPAKGKIVSYSRCHQPKATNPYSAAYEADRINKKLEVLGELRRRLSSEGMKKALSVLVAAKRWEGNQQKYRMALKVMRHRLWKDYGLHTYAGPMPYDAKDFEYGPEIWKQVDTDYANMLRKLFCDMLNAAPAPKWISVKDYVQVRDKENLIEKLRGKLYVTNVYAELDRTGEKLVWMANVVAAKGREWQFEVDNLDPWEDPKKKTTQNAEGVAGGKRKRSGKSQKAQKKPAAKKDARTENKPAVARQDIQSAVEPSIEDRLRVALRKQLAMAV